MRPFAYPPRRRTRRHGPRGYARPAGYRPWLRDEFAFRCAYCLLRDSWGRVRGVFGLDHFRPVRLRPDLTLDYGNLLYCCAICNAAKGARTVPDPCGALVEGAVTV